MDRSGTSPEKTPKKQKVRNDKGTHRKRKEFEVYASFIALTLKERQEQFGFYTDQEFARAHRINAGTLSEWKRDLKLWELRDKHMTAFKQFTAQVLEGVRNRATNQGDPAAAKIWLQFVEGWNPSEKAQIEVTIPGQIDAFL